MIFVDVRDTTITVSGDTFCLNKQLGAQGLGFKFNQNRKRWEGRAGLKALEVLADQSGAILTPKAQDQIDQFRRAAEKRARYMASRAAGVA